MNRNRPDNSRPCIALTFDDGPNTGTTVEILDLLAQYGICGSFFLVGKNINAKTAAVAKRACQMGCELGHHSATHSDMSVMTPAEIAAEMQQTAQDICTISGTPPRFFRPPYIAVSETMFREIDLPFIAGYGVDDFLDSVSAQQRADGVLRQAKDGAIILLHDAEGNSATVEALRTVIPALLQQDYRFVTVSQLFAEKGITPRRRIIYSFAEQTEMYG